MSLKKLSGETLVYGLSSILGRLLNFVAVTPFITRVLSDDEFGQISNLMFWVALLIALLVFRMDTALFRFASRGEYDPQAIFRRTQRLVLGLTLVVIVPLLSFPAWFGEVIQAPSDTLYIQLFLITVAFDALSMVPQARLRLRQRAWFFVAVNLGNVVVNVALLYFLLLYLPEYHPDYYNADFKIGYYFMALAVASALRFFVLMADGLFRTRIKEQQEGGADARGVPSYRRLLGYSMPLTVVSLAGIANFLVGPSILVGYDEALSGYFGAALRMAVFLNLFVTAYQYAAEPFFFRQSSKDLATADRTIYADAMRAYGIVGALASTGIILGLPWLQLFIGQQVRPGLVVLPIILAANYCFGIYSNLSISYKLTDKTMLGAGIAVIGSVFAVGAPLLFTARYGLYAAAYGMLACFLVMCALAYLVSRKYFPVDYPFGRLGLYVLIAAITCYLGTFSEAMWWRILMLVVSVGAVGLLERKWLLRTFGRGAAGGGAH
ncbi:lipopolysaccharide biosynthesis protein [Lewinella sp. IMCC34191]|uniref:lipopolysaccharide biosynthesis protein n=1 Tax=Lewinella sp. IMCC34191 TaxID=2259172 RepID=UPI000E25671A|nr:lipopolysaccharide biosynthesis protein [Lewinella sp. IMCC34191]